MTSCLHTPVQLLVLPLNKYVGALHVLRILTQGATYVLCVLTDSANLRAVLYKINSYTAALLREAKRNV